MRVLDRTGRPQPLQVEVEDAIAYEFVTSLCTFYEKKDHDGLEMGKAWIDEIQARLPPELMAGLDHFCAGGSEQWMPLWGLVYESPAPKTVGSFLVYLEGIDPLEIRLRLLGAHCPLGR